MAVIQTSNLLRTQNSNSFSTFSYNSNLTAGNFSIVFVANYPSGITSVVGSSSGAYTKATESSDSGDNFIEIWYKEGIAGGSETITITPISTGGNYLTCLAQEHSGVSSSSALSRTGSSQNSDTVTASAANTQADCIVFTACIADVGNSNCNFGTPAGYTLIGRENDSTQYSGTQVAYKVVSAVETSSASITSNISGNVDQCIVSFKLGGGGGLNYTIPVSGGAVLGGAPVISKSLGIPVSGGIVLGGASAIIKSLVIPVSGGIVLGGTSSVLKLALIGVSGGVSLGGAVNLSKSLGIPVSGGVSFSGDGGLSFTPGAGTDYTIPVSGGISLSGAVEVATVRVLPVSGGILLGGSSSITRSIVIEVAGGVVFSGDVPISSVKTLLTSGGVVFSGSGNLIFIPEGGGSSSGTQTHIGIGIRIGM